MKGAKDSEVMREKASVVLWWVPKGHRPTVTEGLVRLERLRHSPPGRRAEAFDFGYPRPAPDDRP